MNQLDLSLNIPGAPIIYKQHKPSVAYQESDQIEFGNIESQRFATRYGKHNCESTLQSLRLESRHTNFTENPKALELAIKHSLYQTSSAQVSIVPKAASIAGAIECGAMRIQGELLGSVSSSSWVCIEKDAVLQGPIQKASLVLVAGTIMMEASGLAICCQGLVVLSATARVIGHIQCQSIAIFEGASLVGAVQSTGATQN